jgi:tRNA U38,U39,U40 pseudouridine synthase TruA
VCCCAVLCANTCCCCRQDIAVSKQRFVFGPAQLQRLNSLLAQYEGTHNYHNFTVGLPLQARCRGKQEGNLPLKG